jgi:hypothetical protein
MISKRVSQIPTYTVQISMPLTKPGIFRIFLPVILITWQLRDTRRYMDESCHTNGWTYRHLKILNIPTPHRKMTQCFRSRKLFFTLCRIWGFHGGDYEEYRLLRCGACRCGSSLADFSTLKMEAIRSSETSVQSTTSTRRHTPEDGILHFFTLFTFVLKHDNRTDLSMGKLGLTNSLQLQPTFPQSG